MDLVELNTLIHLPKMRHPWETCRLKALRLILDQTMGNALHVLDIGCGDGFVCRELFAKEVGKDITALDTKLTDSKILEFLQLGPEVQYFNQYEAIKGKLYDLILLLDVLEHIEYDAAFLNEMIANHLAPNGYILLTVPAFQALFCAHDTFLGHYRRYSLRKLMTLINSVGLTAHSSGYLFTSLLLPRFFFKCLEIMPFKRKIQGIGHWNYGTTVTKIIVWALWADIRIALYIKNKFGIKLPGLSAWILCTKY